MISEAGREGERGGGGGGQFVWVLHVMTVLLCTFDSFTYACEKTLAKSHTILILRFASLK